MNAGRFVWTPWAVLAGFGAVILACWTYLGLMIRDMSVMPGMGGGAPVAHEITAAKPQKTRPTQGTLY